MSAPEEIGGEVQASSFSVPKEKTGRLEEIGCIKMGGPGGQRLDWVQCVDCKTDFPILKGRPSCNGHAIEKCPWCRPDSAPWKDGRGI